MFGLGWAEIMVAAVVGLIVIGPKELPVVFRKIGQFVGKAKGMARDFSRAMNDAADDSGMKDAMDSMNSLQDGVRSVTDPTTKWKDFVPGSETSKLSEERAEKTKKMHDSIVDKAQGRLDAVKIANETAEIDPAPKKTVVKKPVRSKKPTKEVIAQKNMTASTKVATSKKTSNKAAPKSGKTS
jgi:sec-independent protein translocase protein TatB